MVKQLPTAAEVRKLVEDLRLSREHFVAVEYRSEAQEMLTAIEMLLQFATWLADREEMARIMQEVNEAKYERGISRAKFEPCCDGTDCQCSICGGIVHYDGTPPEAE